METVTHQDIFKEVRAYLLGLFLCLDNQVIQGYQNNAPLPDDAVVMSILFENDIDVSAQYYDEDKGQSTIQQSVEVVMQIDCYGLHAAIRARQLATHWRSGDCCTYFNLCQPLYCKSLKQLSYINEKNQYESRWVLELSLQYNPEFTHEQNYLDMPIITLEKE